MRHEDAHLPPRFPSVVSSPPAYFDRDVSLHYMLFLEVGDAMVHILNLLTDCHKGHYFLAVLNKAGARDTYPLDSVNTDSLLALLW